MRRVWPSRRAAESGCKRAKGWDDRSALSVSVSGGLALANSIHFISGLPRSGSTLLAGILRQNPKFQASISGPLAEIFTGAFRTMSLSEGSLFVADEQRRRVLTSIVGAYYAHAADRNVVFDTNRGWCSMLPAITQLFPKSRVICCIRNPAWILDSVEQIGRAHV